jgi:hypothetical protein
MKDDWHFYQTDNTQSVIPTVKSNNRPVVVTNGKQTLLRNVFACLVHEREDCIIDMVRNLHYYDASSVILLYNGGEDKALFKSSFPYHLFNAFFYPDPVPVKWGYLHSFALQCMEFALEKFCFDTFTIVDSDQLCIKKGYSEFLSRFLTGKSKIGMLSNVPEKVGPQDQTNHVAVQAHKEYDLWKPLLQSFPEGESKFVHWTFWPSTVFLAEAARDLTKLFRNNKRLHEIMRETKIWATEEVILPTLVRLLGYEIARNPCSYDFVKYKKAFSDRDADRAFREEHAYWMHPVNRVMNDHVRKFISGQSNQYSAANDVNPMPDIHAPVFKDQEKLIAGIRNIEGWLSDAEAELLIATTLKLHDLFLSDINIVEVGSYHGKSTVLFGTLVRACFPFARIYAIDTHDGKLGATDQGLKSYPPSLEKFRQNISDSGITGFVDVLNEKVCKVKWSQPVALLFIDGLHDYSNVAGDFSHFSAWVVPGGFVAFHDYADYFPGVKKLVHEIIQAGTYRRIQITGSLVILQKINGQDAVN